MASKCNNCGGTLVYDIEKSCVRCVHCDSLFDPAAFNQETGADEHKSSEDGPVYNFERKKDKNPADNGEEVSGKKRIKGTIKYETTVFTCPSCGAEIASSDLEAVDYCMYCGTFVTLESQIVKIRKPDYIIPFSKTMEDCKTSYKKSLRGKIYAPREFKDADFIQGFKGIYVPFWNYEYEYGPTLHLTGKTEHRDGDYIETQHYKIKCYVDGKISNLTKDGSSTFDDQLSEGIAPFRYDRLKPFSPAYMFGFYGDTADVPYETYIDDADSDTKEYLWNKVINNPEVRKGHPDTSMSNNIENDFDIKRGISLAMVPVWFLTWRKGDRVAYSVMNGETGNMYSEVPVSIWKYLLFSLLTAVPIFFLLNSLFTFNAADMLMKAMGLAFVTTMLYVFELDKIVRRVMHTDDLGYLVAHPKEKEESDKKVSDNLLYELLLFAWDFIKETGVYFIVGAVVLLAGAFQYVMIGIALVIIAAPIYTIFRLIKSSKNLKDKTVWIDVAGTLGAIIISAVLLFLDPAADIIYYIAAIGCMAGVGFAAIRMVKRYNQLITRPLPHFFDRKGGQS